MEKFKTWAVLDTNVEVYHAALLCLQDRRANFLDYPSCLNVTIGYPISLIHVGGEIRCNYRLRGPSRDRSCSPCDHRDGPMRLPTVVQQSSDQYAIQVQGEQPDLWTVHL